MSTLRGQFTLNGFLMEYRYEASFGQVKNRLLIRWQRSVKRVRRRQSQRRGLLPMIQGGSS